MRSLILIIVLGSIIQHVQGQGYTNVKGRVTTILGQPIAGASVLVLSTGQGTTTDTLGNFSLPKLPPTSLTIRVSAVGYTSREKTIMPPTGPGQPVHILLTEEVAELPEVVVTGQYQPQSAKNSVYQVTTISAQEIEARGALNLQEALANQLNLRFARDNAMGTSNINLQGFSGQNVKVLLDGVPLVGRGGVANEIDINQIDVATIERIEIVEGPMAVNFGADALAGVINIITKKGIAGKFQLQAGYQQETAGSEFSYFAEGSHSPNLLLGYQLSPAWYAQLSSRLNYFGGWQGQGEGRNKAWFPKTQYLTEAMLRHEAGRHSIFYKVNYLNELLENLGPVVAGSGGREASAQDVHYRTNRLIHQLQADWQWQQTQLAVAAAYTDFERSTAYYRYFPESGANTLQSGLSQQLVYRSAFARATATNLLQRPWLSTQLGLEATQESGGGSKLLAGTQRLTDAALFASAEFKIHTKLKLRPGLRATYNSAYPGPLTPSVNVLYSPAEHSSLRFSYGRGYRAPALRELYHEFVDSNHAIYGNPNLEPEHSHSLQFGYTYQNAKLPFTLSLSSFYNHKTNSIGFVERQREGRIITTYLNISEFQSQGVNLQSQYRSQRWQASLGGGVIGLYQQLYTDYQGAGLRKFLYSPELVSSLQYTWPKPKLSANLFYKYTGPTPRYTAGTVPEAPPQLSQIAGFHTLDATLSKRWAGGLTTQVGAKNLANETTLAGSGGGGVHGGGPLMVGLGRSYFLSIHYTLTQ